MVHKANNCPDFLPHASPEPHHLDLVHKGVISIVHKVEIKSATLPLPQHLGSVVHRVTGVKLCSHQLAWTHSGYLVVLGTYKSDILDTFLTFLIVPPEVEL